MNPEPKLIDPANGEPVMRLDNPPAAVAISQDRRAMKLAFDLWNETNPSHPIFTPAWIGDEPAGEWPQPFPLLLKRRFGCAAQGQRFFATPADLRRYRRWRNWRTHGPFWDNYILEQWQPAPREYRLHLVHQTRVIWAQWKQPRDPEAAKTSDPKTSALYRFVTIDKTRLISADLRRQARRAMKATGLQQGAVDIAYDPHRAKTWVFETNARPGVELPELIAAYVAAGAPDPAANTNNTNNTAAN